MTTQRCGLCRKAMHYNNTPDGVSVPCFFYYHDNGFAGLAKDDCKAMGSPVRAWKMATQQAIKRNRIMVSSSNNRASEMGDSQGDNNTPRDGFGVL